MGRNTRQTNSTIKELTFGANAPATTSLVRQHFQEVCRLHLFDQGSMRLCVLCIKAHTTDDWLCHTAMIGGAENCICYSFTWLISKLGKETLRTFVSPSTRDVTPTSICSLFTFLVSIPCSNISQLHVLSISVQCPHVHITLGWLDVLPIICSASSLQRHWRWQCSVKTLQMTSSMQLH